MLLELEERIVARQAAESDRVVSVNIRLYKFVVGAAPWGYRTWRFAIGAETGTFEVDGAPYSEAASLAIDRARAIGAHYVTVLP